MKNVSCEYDQWVVETQLYACVVIENQIYCCNI